MTSGIQNKQIKLQKSIDRIQSRRLDIKKELARNGANQQLKEEHGKAYSRTCEKRRR